MTIKYADEISLRKSADYETVFHPVSKSFRSGGPNANHTQCSRKLVRCRSISSGRATRIPRSFRNVRFGSPRYENQLKLIDMTNCACEQEPIRAAARACCVRGNQGARGRYSRTAFHRIVAPATAVLV